MNFDLYRKRSKPTTESVSFKNENTNNVFIKQLKQFSKYSLYPNCQHGEKLLCSILNINKENIVLGFGSESLLKNIFLTLNYNSIQILEHSYEMAFFYNNLLNKTIITNPLSFNNNKFSFQDIILLGGDLLYIVNPHCPSTIAFTKEEICLFSKQFKYVIVDRAYNTPVNLDLPLLDNVVYVSTFSKLGGVPGLRIGYVVSSREIIHKLNCVRDSYEITIDAIEYLTFIKHNKQLIASNLAELFGCYNLLKTNYNGFSAFCGNFAVFDSDRFKGKQFEASGKTFTRVTLTDKRSYENLYSR